MSLSLLRTPGSRGVGGCTLARLPLASALRMQLRHASVRAPPASPPVQEKQKHVKPGVPVSAIRARRVPKPSDGASPSPDASANADANARPRPRASSGSGASAPPRSPPPPPPPSDASPPAPASKDSPITLTLPGRSPQELSGSTPTMLRQSAGSIFSFLGEEAQLALEEARADKRAGRKRKEKGEEEKEDVRDFLRKMAEVMVEQEQETAEAAKAKGGQRGREQEGASRSATHAGTAAAGGAGAAATHASAAAATSTGAGPGSRGWTQEEARGEEEEIVIFRGPCSTKWQLSWAAGLMTLTAGALTCDALYHHLVWPLFPTKDKMPELVRTEIRVVAATGALMVGIGGYVMFAAHPARVVTRLSLLPRTRQLKIRTATSGLVGSFRPLLFGPFGRIAREAGFNRTANRRDRIVPLSAVFRNGGSAQGAARSALDSGEERATFNLLVARARLFYTVESAGGRTPKVETHGAYATLFKRVGWMMRGRTEWEGMQEGERIERMGARRRKLDSKEPWFADREEFDQVLPMMPLRK